MQNVTPEHLASVTRAALKATALHRRNVGIYGNSSCSDEDLGTSERWLQVRDYYDKKDLQTWTYDGRRKSQYRRAMAQAEKFVEVTRDRIVAAKVLELLEADLHKRHERRVNKNAASVK